jgi:hypothetical protein
VELGRLLLNQEDIVLISDSQVRQQSERMKCLLSSPDCCRILHNIVLIADHQAKQQSEIGV